jgi:hypothetical protein
MKESMKKLVEVSGSHGVEYEDDDFIVGCCTAYPIGSLTFRTRVAPIARAMNNYHYFGDGGSKYL